MTRPAVLRHLTSPSSMLMTSTVVSYAIAFVTGAIQARLLGPVGRGELATAVVPATLIAMLATLNVQDHFANRAAVGEDTSRLARQSAGTALVVGAVAVPVYVAGISVAFDPGSHVWWILLGYALTLPLTIFTTSAVWIAMGSSAWSTVAWSRVVPGMLLVAGLGVLAVAGAGVLGVGAVVVTASALGPLLVVWLARLVPRGLPDFSAVRAAVTFGLSAWPASTIWLLSQRIDSLVVTAVASKDDVGYYVVAVSIASMLMAVSNAVGLPARNHAAQGDLRAARRRLGVALVATTGAGAVLALVVPILVPVVFGEQFRPVHELAWVLILAQVPLAGATVLSLSLVGAGHPTRPLVGVSLGLATTMGSMVALHPLLGVEGIAVASLLGVVVTFLCLLVEAQRTLGLLTAGRRPADDAQEVGRGSA